MTDLDSLRAIVSDLEAKVSRLSVSRSPVIQTSVCPSASTIPYWEVTHNGNPDADAATLTPGTDWDPFFDLPDQWKRTTRLVTAGGEIMTVGTHGIATRRRYSIQWDSPSNQTVLCSMTGWYEEVGEPSGTVQIKMNGDVTEYPEPSLVSLKIKEGRNRLVISTDIRPILMTFNGVLFDGKTSKWVEPRIS